MNILVVGSGGREHAIVKKIKKDNNIFVATGNGGISQDATLVDVKVTDVDGMVKFATQNEIDFCIVAPEDPLALGMVDIIEKANIPCFGPSIKAAIIEKSKVYSKHLMKKYNIPTAAYEVFDSSVEAMEYVKKQNDYPTVVKADGLAVGKGVIIANNYEEACDAIKTIMEDKVFGDSGNSVVIEEFLEGEEVSVLSFCDSKTIIPMISAMDHKRVFDNDEGLNTGGMGTIAPNPYYTEDIAKECMEKIFKPTMDALNEEERPFKGCIFFGLMITKKGVKVIEYNCRFGDPETQVVLSLLESDLLDIFVATANEKLSECEVKFSNKHACCIMLASGGYPQKYDTGIEISGLDKLTDSVAYHSGTKLEGDKFYTAGGRVLGITAIDDSLKSAIDKCYSEVDKIKFDGMHYRKDIGARGLNINE